MAPRCDRQVTWVSLEPRSEVLAKVTSALQQREKQREKQQTSLQKLPDRETGRIAIDHDVFYSVLDRLERLE
eukprot:757950-Hanusia_phi.AAC.6